MNHFERGRNFRMFSLQCREQSLLKFIKYVRQIFISENGVAAIEFGFIFPIMFVMYIGMAAFVIGIEINSKLAFIAESMGNLTGRASSVNEVQLLNFFSASNTLMSPYSAAPVNVRIGSIVKNKDGMVKKCWGASLSNSSTPSAIIDAEPPSLSELGLPDEIMPISTTLIVVEATYIYKSYFPDIKLIKNYYTRARTSFETAKQKSDGSFIICP